MKLSSKVKRPAERNLNPQKLDGESFYNVDYLSTTKLWWQEDLNCCK